MGIIRRVYEGVRWRVQPALAPLQWRLRRFVVRPVSRFRDQHFHAISQGLLKKTLGGVLPANTRVLLVHSSLSRCGFIQGGPEAVIRELRQFAPVLTLPTHTYCYPNQPTQAGPIYDPRVTASCVGAITNFFWNLPEVMRSIHPTHSLAALGPAREKLLEGHELCKTPCGKGTPYEKLIEQDASVLMFGATMNTYTLFHTTEDAAGCPYLYFPEVYHLQALDYNGALHSIRMSRQNMSVPRRFQEMHTVLEREGLLKRARLGRGELLFLPSARSVHAFVVDQMMKDPFYLVAESYRREVDKQCG